MSKKMKDGLFILRIFIIVMVVLIVPVKIFEKPAVTTQFPNRIQKVLPSVVHIMCDQWQGSGVALTEDIIVTARHVVDGINYTITLSNGCQVRGVQAISHKDYDVGFIKIDGECVTSDCKKHKHRKRWNVDVRHKIELCPAKFGSIKDCVLGQSIFIIGSPYGKINFNSVSAGHISGLGRDWDGIDPWTGDYYGWKIVFTSDSAAHPGNSGGPVFTMDGVVRGLLVGGYSPVLNCSMPSDLFMDDVELIKMMFAQDKYKVEKKKVPAYYESREDYYLDD